MLKISTYLKKISIPIGVITFLVLTIWTICKFPQQYVEPLQQQIDVLTRSKADPKDLATQLKGRLEVENATRTGIIQGVGGFLVLVTLYISWRNLKATEEKQVAERFSKAVEQLASKDNIHSRLGGIYALEQIAKDAEEKYYWPVMETLTAYVREKSPYPPKESNEKTGQPETEDIPPLPTDIQAVMTVLGRRKHSYKNGEDHRLDLKKTDLRGLQLQPEAKLQGVDFTEACLQKAVLWKVELQGAYPQQ
ncbi:MAG: hypothetical protein C6Y22_23715 [Hapalosiphonaceae cyanobacterium JJU2]|nr:MAG: hypothetical protein C6Y22_23715 [Hapalosiphonaceae cyanobacterium JJU2]